MPRLDSIAPVAPPAAARGVAAGRGVSRSLRGRPPRFRPRFRCMGMGSPEDPWELVGGIPTNPSEQYELVNGYNML